MIRTAILMMVCLASLSVQAYIKSDVRMYPNADLKVDNFLNEFRKKENIALFNQPIDDQFYNNIDINSIDNTN